jgi:hypothetical protein
MRKGGAMHLNEMPPLREMIQVVISNAVGAVKYSKRLAVGVTRKFVILLRSRSNERVSPAERV